MEQIEKLQEEFEQLIEQLDRLKAINEITEENSENAKLVIYQMEVFVGEVAKFKKTVNEDFKLKSEGLTKLQVSFKATIESLESIVNKQAVRFEKLAQENNENSNKAIGSFRVESSMEINELKASIASSIDKQTKEIKELKGSLVSSIGKQTKEMNDAIAKMKASSKATGDELNKEISMLKAEHKKTKEESRIQIDGLSDQINVNFNGIKNWILFILVLVCCLGVGFLILLR